MGWPMVLSSQSSTATTLSSHRGPVIFFGRVFFLISSGGQAPHARCTPMRRACGEPDDIELAAIGVKLNTRIHGEFAARTLGSVGWNSRLSNLKSPCLRTR